MLHRRLRPLVPLVPLLLGGVASASCSSKQSGLVALTTGGEADALTKDPPVKQLVVETVDQAGVAVLLAKVSLPAATVDLADVSGDAVATVRVTGIDANGAARVSGTSLPLQFAALAGAALTVFVQRTGELARMPAPLADSRELPVLGAAVGRFVFVAGGADPGLSSTSQLYDLASYAPLPAPPKLPRAARSMAMFGAVALLVDDAGASSFDLATSTAADVAAPAGGSFAEVAGGATITTPDGSSYIVGATRAESPSARVLRIDKAGALSFLSLVTARVGAAAAWVEGRGLVIAGGSASATGAEILGPGATNGIALPFPGDGVTGAGATTLDATHVLLAGGVDGAGADGSLRVLDVACAVACAPVAWGSRLRLPLARTQAFRIDAGAAFVVGDDATGATHAFRVSADAAIEIALKAPRRRARAVKLPTGGIAIVGGAAVMESFVP